MVGGLFSALEPLAFLGMALYTVSMARRGGRKHANRIALSWSVGCGIMSFVGAGFLGFAHTLPQVNIWTHGTLVTAMHGHLAFWGAYAMLIFGMIAYALPEMTGRKLYNHWANEWAFWLSNIGMVAMTGAFAVAGVTQVYLERRVGMDFLEVQKAVQVHFFEARSDVVVVLHPLTDHRRQLFVDLHDELLSAPPGFMLVVSFNPGYQRSLKEMKPSTRQRFVGLSFDFPAAPLEERIVQGETEAEPATCRRLVALAKKVRSVEHLGLAERPSTRLLVDTARLIKSGLPARLACRVGIVEPLTDDAEVATAIQDLVHLVFD